MTLNRSTEKRITSRLNIRASRDSVPLYRMFIKDQRQGTVVVGSVADISALRKEIAKQIGGKHG